MSLRQGKFRIKNRMKNREKLIKTGHEKEEPIG